MTAISVLSANVGTLSPWCAGYEFNCCRQGVEVRVGAAIRALEPDLVFLQEVTPYAMAVGRREWHPRRVGYRAANRQVHDQIRRLLGSEYTIVCDPHRGTECVAIRRGVGRFAPDLDGRPCPEGALGGTRHSDQGTVRYETPFVASSHDDGFVVMAVDAELSGTEVRLLNAHPQALTHDRARADQLETALERWGDHPRILLAGDCNLDPFRQDDEAVTVWHRHVDRYDDDGQLVEAGQFHYHSGVAEAWPPRPTAHPPWPIPDLTLDHVVSTFATGRVRTLSGPANLDGGRGMDHDALFGTLTIA